MPATCSFLVAILLLQASPASAGPGLRGPPQTTPPVIDVASVESSLLSELSSNFNGGAATQHVAQLQESLRPMYAAVPKKADGTLDRALVRYMLHRYFVQKHGWFIRGLEPSGSVHNKVEPGNKSLQSLSEWVPSYLHNFVEELQGGSGISARELAVLAATLENLIHKESVQRLEMTFNALELPRDSELNTEKLRQALEVYMMIYMLGGNFTVKGQAGVLQAHKVFTDKVRDWDTVQDWMHNIQLEVAPASADRSLNFSSATRVVEEVGRRYGTYNDAECNTLKSELLQIESTKAGRVRLAEFYKKGLSGVFEFNEKIEYLRTLGNLDESNASDPLVIVPNYVASRPNCLVASGFYVVCCRNECEDLLGELEKKFQAPTAKPEQILELIESMPSATVEAPRKLSGVSVQRLQSIADANEGEVPLHGRLFALWMHHAFPRECPYPQKAGTSSPQTPDEWMQATGHEDAKKTKEEMQMIVDSDGACNIPKGPEAREHHDKAENGLPWDEVEELPTTIEIRSSKQAVSPILMQASPATETPQRSMLNSATPVASLAFFVFGLVVCAWKVAAQRQEKQGPVSTVQQLIDRAFAGRSSADAGELPDAQQPAHYVYF